MRTILFVGHRPDTDDRPTPRFPADAEGRARTAIREVVARLALPGAGVRGIAGGASGGDIIFHEVCLSLGVASTLCLALPEAAFIAASVAPSGDAWVRRFRRIAAMLPAHHLAAAPPLAAPDDALWEMNNEWLLREGLADGAENLTLIAMWDGEAGDGPGGTDGLVAMAQQRGVHVEIVDTRRLSTGAGPRAGPAPPG